MVNSTTSVFIMLKLCIVFSVHTCVFMFFDSGFMECIIYVLIFVKLTPALGGNDDININRFYSIVLTFIYLLLGKYGGLQFSFSILHHNDSVTVHIKHDTILQWDVWKAYLQFRKLYSQPHPQMLGDVLRLNFDTIKTYFSEIYDGYTKFSQEHTWSKFSSIFFFYNWAHFQFYYCW